MVMGKILSTSRVIKPLLKAAFGVLMFMPQTRFGIGIGSCAIRSNFLEQGGHALALVLLISFFPVALTGDVAPNIRSVLNGRQALAVDQTVQNALSNLDAETAVTIPVKALVGPQSALVAGHAIVPVIRILRSLFSR